MEAKGVSDWLSSKLRLPKVPEPREVAAITVKNPSKKPTQAWQEATSFQSASAVRGALVRLGFG